MRGVSMRTEPIDIGLKTGLPGVDRKIGVVDI
jgi:hypothetical protein